MPNYSLAADTLALTAEGVAAGNALYADPGTFSLSFPDVALTRNFALSLDLDLTRLSRLSAMVPIINPKTGAPTQKFQFDLQRTLEAVETAYNRLASAVTAIQTAYNAAAQAQQAATEATSIVAEVREEITTVSAQVEGIKTGTVAIERLNVGGQQFVNDGGSLTVDTA